MHFQVIKDNYYENIIERLGFYNPDFHSIFEKEDGIYLIMGDLANYVLINAKNKDIIENTSKFINEALSMGGSETEDIIVLQLFEVFYESELISNKIRENLDNHSKEIFDKYRYLIR